MRLTLGQKRAIHAAARQAGLDEAAYRLILKNVGDVTSAASPLFRRDRFILCMATFEDLAGGRLRGCASRYWAEAARTARPADALLYRVLEAAHALGWSDQDLNEFLVSDRMSSGRFTRISDVPARWLVKVLEALKAMNGRLQTTGYRPQARPGRRTSSLKPVASGLEESP